MTQDFASTNRKSSGEKRKSPSNKRTAARAGTSNAASPGIWFGTGLLCGIFLSGLSWLASQRQDATGQAASASQTPLHAAVATPERGPRFDFYTLLPEQKVEVEVDPASIDAARNSPSNDQFLLQAGSFQLAEDADRRRGELILLGLDSHVQKTSVDNGRWYRVYIGPFESRSKLAKARGVTAQQGIDTLLLKRPPGA
jgi:cell division protein FtsN